GGKDKPNGSGGDDKADQDGNNGCGNDDDFEDDNNGNCGGKKKDKDDDVKVDETCPKDKSMPKGHKDCDDDDDRDKDRDDDSDDDDDVVQPDVIQAPAAPVAAPAKVLGLTVTRKPALRPGVAPAVVRGARQPGAVLPFTGAGALQIMLLGLGMMASGAIVMRAVRK
ncbi:MAG TPA: hypothetical protein VE174_07620, partial [Actinomycetota bacterium]|nr:hypothetical protein [Actinomycetota bacterium]